MEKKALEITQRATLIFSRYGIKSVTMDEVASQLGISKKTLYKYFKDKNDLIVKGVQLKINADEKQCGEACIVEGNAIDELFAISEFVIQNLSSINPSVIFDLKKYHPEAFEILYNHKWGFVLKSIRKNIIRGIEEGIYRDNIDPEIIARHYVGSTDLIMEGSIFPWPEFTMEKVYLEILRFQIRGLANAKGTEYLTNKINNL